MGIEVCGEILNSIRALEGRFVRGPSRDDGILLDCFWKDVLSKYFEESETIAKSRINLFSGYVGGKVSDSEVVEYLKKNPLPKFENYSVKR